MLEKFKEYNSFTDMPKFDNDIQLMEIAQHYGLPTLLLDWTTDPLVALYFALSNIMLDDITNNQDSYATVWIINPLKINESTFDELENDVLNSKYDADRILYEMKLAGTFCFEGTKSRPRICGQSGNFTFTNLGLTYTMNFVQIYQKNIYKINIPYIEVENFKELFNLLDLSEKSIYFGKTAIDQITEQIKKESYEKFIDNLFKSNCSE